MNDHDKNWVHKTGTNRAYEKIELNPENLANLDSFLDDLSKLTQFSSNLNIHIMANEIQEGLLNDGRKIDLKILKAGSDSISIEKVLYNAHFQFNSPISHIDADKTVTKFSGAEMIQIANRVEQGILDLFRTNLVTGRKEAKDNFKEMNKE